jgi:UDP-glucose 4-epimerase
MLPTLTTLLVHVAASSVLTFGYRNVVGIFINQIMRGEPMTIFGDGGQSRAFSHIADVAPYIAIAPFVPAAQNQDFFVGRDERTSVGELSGLVAAAMGVKPNVNHLPQRHEVVHAYAVHDKLRCVFNPREPISLKEGLKQTAEYSKRLGSFEPTGYSKTKFQKNLPPSWQVALSRLQSATSASKYNQNRDQDGE